MFSNFIVVNILQHIRVPNHAVHLQITQRSLNKVGEKIVKNYLCHSKLCLLGEFSFAASPEEVGYQKEEGLAFL